MSGTVGVTVQASDNVAVSKVELYLDGQLFGTDTEAPYQFDWDTTLEADADRVLLAKAYDTSANPGESLPVSIKVDNQADEDRTAPQVSFSSPPDGAIFRPKTILNILVDASDDRGVVQVRILVNDSLVCTDQTPPYNCSWKIPAKPAVIYRLRAEATDAAGNLGQSTIRFSSQRKDRKIK